MFGQRLRQQLNQLPVYNDQGQILGVNGSKFARPVDNTDLALSNHMAQMSHFVKPLAAQANNMDEAYNRSMMVKSQTFAPSPQRAGINATNSSVQAALFKIFGGK